MHAVPQSSAQNYRPSSADASQAAAAFIAKATDWAQRRDAAMSNLLAIVVANTGLTPRGVVARDPLQMTSEALVFDEAPASGFMAVPDDFAEMLRAQGVRGNAYFPMVETQVGRTVMTALNALSHVAQNRPLLTGVRGLKSFAIQDDRLVLSHAYGEGEQLRIRATPAAVEPNAELTSMAAPTAAAASTTESRFSLRR